MNCFLYLRRNLFYPLAVLMQNHTAYTMRQHHSCYIQIQRWRSAKFRKYSDNLPDIRCHNGKRTFTNSPAYRPMNVGGIFITKTNGFRLHILKKASQCTERIPIGTISNLSKTILITRKEQIQCLIKHIIFVIEIIIEQSNFTAGFFHNGSD